MLAALALNPAVFERLHDFWVDRHPLVRFGIILLVIAGLAAGLAKPALGWYRGWQSDRKTEAAQQALDGTRYAEARDLALRALRSGGDQARLIPILLRASAALDDPRQVDMALSLILVEGIAEEDRHLAWSVLCQHAPGWPLMMIWGELSRKELGDEAMALELVDRLLRDDLLVEAAKVLAPLPPSDADEREARLLELLLAKGTPEAHREFMSKLLALLLDRPDARDRWLSAFDRLPFGAMSEREAESMIYTLRAGGPLAGMDFLRDGRCRMRFEPDKADAHFSSALKRATELEPAERAAWCLQVGRPEAAAGELPPNPPLAGELRLQWRILAALGNRENQLDFLEEAPGEVVYDWQGALYRELKAQLESDEKAARNARGDALRAALESADHDAPVELARHAEELDLKTTAAEAWLQGVRHRRGPVPLSHRLKWVIEFFAAEKREEDLLAMLAAYRAIEPGNPVITAQHDYLACLQGRLEPATLIENVRPILDQRPDELPLQAIVALGHLLLEQPQQAREVTDKPTKDWFAVTPLYRALRAIALEQSGEPGEAAVLLEDFPWNELMPSERRVLEALRASQ